MNKDLGYYICNGIEFASKIEACLYAQTVNKPIEWIFHQDEYMCYPWWIEPTETLDELYDKRAREIREQYDYVVISYSGGADSHNIVRSFMRQGLHIDEIVTNHITDITKNTVILNASNKSSSNFSAEHQLQAIPRLQYLYDNLPKTKITVIDVSEMIIDSINSFKDESWILDRKDNLQVGGAFRYNYFYFNSFKKQFDKDKKVAIVLGVDKPKTKLVDGKFLLYFSDSTANVIATNDANEYQNVKVELFYWAKTTAPLICKQAHIIRRWLIGNPELIPLWEKDDYKTSRLIHERYLRSLLYTTWENDWYQADKGTSWWNCEFDDWFHTNKQFSAQQSIWQNGIDYLTSHATDYVVENQLGKPDSLKQFLQFYYIGSFQHRE